MDPSGAPAAAVAELEGHAVAAAGLEKVVPCGDCALEAVARLADLQDEEGNHCQVLEVGVAAAAAGDNFRTETAWEDAVVADLVEDRLHRPMVALVVHRMDFQVVSAAEVHLDVAEVAADQVHIEVDMRGGVEGSLEDLGLEDSGLED